jgi:hypothetical protein
MFRVQGDDAGYEHVKCACARLFVNEELLLSSLKAFAQFIRSVHATLNVACFQCASSIRTV